MPKENPLFQICVARFTREVREEFRDRWADYYAERKAGADGEYLDAMKAQLIADQREILATRRDEACSELREFAQRTL